MKYLFGAQTHVGKIREANEDSYLVKEPLFVVADGMGGHVAGDIASSTAVQVIADNSNNASPSDPHTLVDLVRSANAEIFKKATGDPHLRGMGTTCTLVLLDGAKAHFAHVGDSRAYLLRDGELSQITEDHSLVGRMVKEGRLRPEEADIHPQRSIVTRALGVDSDVEVDLMSLDLKEGDRLLLCSDGLSSMIDGASIEDVLRSETDPQAAANRLVDLANQAGGEDNITVVIVDVTERESNGSASSVAHAPEPGEIPAEEPAHHRTWPRKLIVSVLVLAALAAGAFYAANYVLDNSWYVGVTSNEVIAIYQGIPEDVFGLDLDEEVEVTQPELVLSDLPPNLREPYEDGRKADSLSEARQIVGNLEERAADFGEVRRDRQEPKEGEQRAGSKKRGGRQNGQGGN
jgi:protein phosphatase